MNEPPQNEIIIYNTEDGKSTISLFARDGSVWLNQSQMAELFDTSKPNISIHISNILKEKELSEDSVVKDYLTTASDGKKYHVAFYSLEMIIAVGFRVRSPRGTQFRQWANRNLAEYMRKGFILDDERLKNPDDSPGLKRLKLLSSLDTTQLEHLPPELQPDPPSPKNNSSRLK